MITMMILIHLIMLLIIGFGVGYWLLVTANKHEGRLKSLGEVLGTTLIAIVILYSMMGFFYSMNLKDKDYMPGMGQQKTQMSDKEENEKNEEMQEGSKEEENKPIK